jgi:hypothetical protein
MHPVLFLERHMLHKIEKFRQYHHLFKMQMLTVEGAEFGVCE